MAVPLTEDIQQDDDIQKLSLAQSYYTMSESAAWADLSERIGSLVLKAKQEMFASKTTDPQTILAEKIRWQEAELLQAAIDKIVSSQRDLREQILEDMKSQGEINEYSTAE